MCKSRVQPPQIPRVRGCIITSVDSSPLFLAALLTTSSLTTFHFSSRGPSSSAYPQALRGALQKCVWNMMLQQNTFSGERLRLDRSLGMCCIGEWRCSSASGRSQDVVSWRAPTRPVASQGSTVAGPEKTSALLVTPTRYYPTSSSRRLSVSRVLSRSISGRRCGAADVLCSPANSAGLPSRVLCWQCAVPNMQDAPVPDDDRGVFAGSPPT